MENITESHTVLDTEELALISNKYAKSKLAFAVMLKFFQLKNRFPTRNDNIPELLIIPLSQQLKVDPTSMRYFNWEGRACERFRQEIRELLGFRKATGADKKQLIAWLIAQVLPQAPTPAQCEEQVIQFFNEHKLEPFSPKVLARYIRSAKYQFEKNFFKSVYAGLSTETIDLINYLLKTDDDGADEIVNNPDAIKLRHLKKDIAGAKLKNVKFEIDKLTMIRKIKVPTPVFDTISRKQHLKYYTRIMAEVPSKIEELDSESRYGMMAMFCYIRSQLLTDNLVDVFIRLNHKMKVSAEASVTKNIVTEIKRVDGKFDILYTLASTASAKPQGIIQDEIYPKVSQETLCDLTTELQHKRWYDGKVKNKMRALYSHANRKVLLALLDAFIFHTNHPEGKTLLQAIAFIKNNRALKDNYYPDAKIVPIKQVIPNDWQALVVQVQNNSNTNKGNKSEYQINRLNYEIVILEALCQHLTCKTIWVEGAYRYRNPDEDLPKDFESRREYYYQLLGLPLDPEEFLGELRKKLDQQLQQLNETILSNEKVKIIDKKGGRIKVSPSAPQTEPFNLKLLQKAINKRWSTVNLIDVLKEADLRIGFTQQFYSVGKREIIGKADLRKRLLLCLYAIGSNTGLKRISAANADATYEDLRYIKRRFIHVVNVRAAIVEIVNAILAVRDPLIWGEATTGCACDSTQVSSWDQNLMTEWHVRYRGRGVMIYWHVDKKSACIYSQLKTCSSSEVASMIKGVLMHNTLMDMNETYVDTHGQSTIGFGCSRFLNFDLRARLKNINKQKLYCSTAKDKEKYPHLVPILKSPINWNLVKENYDEVVKHMVALKIGLVEPDVLIKRFSKDNYDYPVYKALTEVGKAEKTLFLCQYLASEELRIEIHEALNVVERLNSIMSFIFYGKLGEISTNKTDEQELSVVCLHLLQVCMVYINTLMIQEVLSDPVWQDKLTLEDKRALTPLLHGHINPYGLFPLDLNQRLVIEVLQKIFIQQNPIDEETFAENAAV